MLRQQPKDGGSLAQKMQPKDGGWIAQKMGKFLESSGVVSEQLDSDESLESSGDDSFLRASSLERQAKAVERAHQPYLVYAPAAQAAAPTAPASCASAVEKELQQQAIKEVEAFAEYLGMEVAADRDLLWIAVEAMTAPLPPNWTQHETKDGQPYYYNQRTDHTQWEHPMDEYHRGLYKKLKTEKAKGSTKQQAAAKLEVRANVDGPMLALAGRLEVRANVASSEATHVATSAAADGTAAPHRRS